MPITFPAQITDLHFTDDYDTAVLTLSIPASAEADKNTLRQVNLASVKYSVTFRRMAEIEDLPHLGVVSSFRTKTFDFLYRPREAGAPPLGSYVLTRGGIVAVIIDAQSEAPDLFKELARKPGGLTPERIASERPVVTYTAHVLGGLNTGDDGAYAYYHRPLYPPNIGEAVWKFKYSESAQQFFRLDQIYRLSVHINDIRDDHIVAAMIKNAAELGHGNVEDYKDAILSTMDDFKRLNSLEDACTSIFGAKIP